jgi:GH15 family glucan-1,4-alpha-glucosidase
MAGIQDYALIGNGHSGALVSNAGSIDWLCWPRFDSEPLFARLLDDEQGSWSIDPASPYEVDRRYIEETAILETCFSARGGKAVVTDVMPLCGPPHASSALWPQQEIVRKVQCLEGTMHLRLSLLMPKDPSKFRSHEKGVIVKWEHPSGDLFFYSPVAARMNGRRLEGEWTMRAGESLYFSLSLSEEAPAVISSVNSGHDPIAVTRRWWEEFCTQISYEGPYRDVLVRSAITLKLLTYAPSGAIIAAPTTSLPEKLGGSLNWDYRYCWLRDASMATHALMALGLSQEAKAFVNWLLHSTNLSRPKLNVLYEVYGRKPRKERVQNEWAGFGNSKPVRFGNEAATQEQMDLYGEVIHGAYIVLRNEEKIDRETQRMLRELGEYICRHWQDPDAGMWEVRGRKEYFTHSLLMCWTGLHDLRLLHDKGLLSRLKVDQVHGIEDQIAASIAQTAWNEDSRSFASRLQGSEVDANLLLMPWYGFLAFDSAVMRQTYERIQEELATSEGLLYRNREQDEGVFMLCALWAVEYLARGGGSLDEARALLETVIACLNDVGLLAEEFDPSTGEQLGNFPLAFSHLGLINAVLAIDERTKRPLAEVERSVV